MITHPDKLTTPVDGPTPAWSNMLSINFGVTTREKLLMNIEGMNTADLKALRERIDAQIAAQREGDIAELRERIKTIVAEAGFSIEEVFPRSPSRPRPSSPAKPGATPLFVNPADPTQRWQGRGPKPDWVVAYIEQHGSLESCRAAPPAAA